MVHEKAHEQAAILGGLDESCEDVPQFALEELLVEGVGIIHDIGFERFSEAYGACDFVGERLEVECAFFWRESMRGRAFAAATACREANPIVVRLELDIKPHDSMIIDFSVAGQVRSAWEATSIRGGEALDRVWLLTRKEPPGSVCAFVRCLS